MKKKLLFLLCAMMAHTGVFADLQQDSAGNYLIGNANDLLEFSLFVRSGNTSANAKLTADIDMTGVNDLIPIGFFSDEGNHVDLPYHGVFNGAGHVIKNLSITMDDSYEVGLIGRGVNCTVKNLGIDGAKMVSEANVRTGVIGGELANCIVENCYVIGDIEIVTEHEQRGAIAAEAHGTTSFTNCYTTYEMLTSNIGGAMNNCYESEEVEYMQPGELCFLLNGDQSHIVWYQTIGQDAYPTQDPTHAQVYAHGKLNCDGTPAGAVVYNNDETGSAQIQHDFDEDGYCSYCGTDEGKMYPTEDGWYEISTFAQLRYFQRIVNGGATGSKGRLMNDIDMENRYFEPIGYHNDSGSSTDFRGTFDGQGHTLFNLYIDVTDGQEAGLFGRISGGGTIKNFGVINAVITNRAGIRAGVLAGEIHACNVSYCFTGGSIEINTDHQQKGGISGEAAASNLSNCYTTYDVLTNAAGSVNNCFWGTIAQENAETGALCYMLNGNSFFNPAWYQTLEEDECPVLDSTHGLVYPTGEDSYACAVTDEDFNEMVDNVITAETKSYRAKIATKELTESYVASLAELVGTSYEQFIEKYNALSELRAQIAESEQAYASYIEKLNQIKAYLEENPGLVGVDMDILNTYLFEEKAADETYPNGTSLSILKSLTLNAEEVQEETAFAGKLLDNAIERCYQAGSEISSLLVNADFTQPNAQGWTYAMGAYDGGASAAGEKNVITTQNQQMDIYQTVKDLRPGIYEVRISGYSEIEGAEPTCAYNYGAFIYANGNYNYYHTPYTDLLTEEEKDTNPSYYGERYDADGNLMGWGPNSWTSLCYAFGMGHFENRILVNVTEGELKLGVMNLGTYNKNNDTFLSNTRLFYHGSIDQAGDALSSQLENMVEIASHILADYFPDNSDYYAAPNFSEALRAELNEEVTQAAQVTAGQQTYDLICRMSQTFMDIYKTKDAYIKMMAAVELVYDAVCNIGTYEDIVNFEDAYYTLVNDAFLEGTFSADEANKITDELLQSSYYLQTYGEEPELVEGEYVCSTPYHLVWISNQVNSGRNRGLHFALANDIDMSEIVNFSPIGTYIDGGKQNYFNGQFDGRCHVIRNLNIVVGDATETGFFSRAVNSTIMNVGIINANIINEGGARAGVLGGELHLSTIRNCFTAGELNVDTSYEQCTGFAGETASSSVINCYTTHQQLTNQGRLENCYSAADGLDAASGELCYNLNAGSLTPVYYQTLGEDAFPVLDNTHSMVYLVGEQACDGTPLGNVSYSNDASDSHRQPHEYDKDGYCVNCGADKGESYADEKGVYHLTNNYGLRWFSNLVNSGKTQAMAVLDVDVDMSGIAMQPIGRYSDDHEFDGTNRTFFGSFDGQGHEIRNLNIVIEDRQEGGLFGRAAGSAQIKNFGLVNPTVVNTHARGCRLGAVCGELNGATISNVYIVGDITLQTSNVQLCSFAGEAAQGKIVNCYALSDLRLSNLGAHTNCYSGDEAREMAPTGELCYKLNNGDTEAPVWRQTLNEDSYPVLREDHKIVYLEDGSYTNDNEDAIETVEQTATSIKGIYTITGMKVLDEPQNLKKGLYIIDGRKVLIR